MTAHIVRREILENLLSLRFMLSLLLVISLFVTGAVVFIGKYQREFQNYWEESNKNLWAFGEQTEQLHRLAVYKQNVWRKPEPLTFCADGFEKYFPNWFSFSVFTVDLPEVKGQSNFILPRSRDIDWVSIVSLILSFAALLLTYDSICGEKETGTLRLILAGPIPRHKVLLAKYFGAMFTLGIPLLMGLLLNIIIVLFSDVIGIGAGDWFRIVGIVLLSYLYLSVFVLLGIFVSSRTSHSAVSMVTLIFVWAGVAILIPSFGRFLSSTFWKSPARARLESKLAQVDEKMRADVRSGKFGKRAGSDSYDRDSPRVNPPARARWKNAWEKAKNQVREEHLRQMMASVVRARRITRISPTVVYQCASEALVGTGMNRFSDLWRQIKMYRGNLKEYIVSNDREDPNSLHLLFPDEHATRKWTAISNMSVDFDTVPKFQERDLALGQSLKLAIWDIGLLVLFNLVFFTAAFVSFLKYDVR